MSRFFISQLGETGSDGRELDTLVTVAANSTFAHIRSGIYLVVLQPCSGDVLLAP